MVYQSRIILGKGKNNNGCINVSRHPEPDERPLFFDIMIPLQKPDFQILKWSDNEGEGEALTLGAPLEKGRHLYRDLQRTYARVQAKMHPQRVGEGQQRGKGMGLLLIQK